MHTEKHGTVGLLTGDVSSVDPTGTGVHLQLTTKELVVESKWSLPLLTVHFDQISAQGSSTLFLDLTDKA